MSIGENIKEYRKQKGLTQSELAKEIGKSESTIQKYEANEVIPPIEMLNKISNALEVSIFQLIDNENFINLTQPNEYEENLKTRTLADYSTKELLLELVRRNE